MKNLLNPRWLFLINTLPIIALFLLEYADFQLIKTLLEPKSIALWRNFTFVLVILWLVNIIYALYAIRQKSDISPIYSVFALVGYSIYLYLYCYHSWDIMPESVPQWMVSDNIMMYVGSFLMPTIAHGLLSAVVYFTPDDKKHSVINSLSYMVVIPAAWYFFAMIMIPLCTVSDPGAHALTIVALSAAIGFLFFLVRFIYIIAMSRGEFSAQVKLIFYIFIGIVFPLLGLLLNKQMANTVETGFFGNFNSIWFYIIALVNGVLICLPQPKDATAHLVLFLSKSVTFAYTLYFFLVFLPFLPLSILAITVFGTGFLMLTPLVLFVIQSKVLADDFKILKQYFNPKTLIISFLASITVLPLCIILSYWHDRTVLNDALAYLYTPDYTKTYDLDKNSIQKTIALVKKHKNRNARGGLAAVESGMGANTPYLSMLFSWIVLDNMTLSDAKIKKMEDVFVGKSQDTTAQEKQKIKNETRLVRQIRSLTKRNDVNGNPNVNISKIGVETTFDSTQNAYKTWVNLEMTNKSDSDLAEFAGVFDLPKGCFISDYYLYIGDQKTDGLLVEKKAATWVYQQVTTALIPQDPGILTYLPDNKISFKIFPFTAHETRKTGFEILHKTPFELNFNQNLIKININSSENNNLSIKNTKNELKNAIYIDSEAKKQLEKVERTPYFHFIVDISNKSDISSLKKQYINQINTVLDKKWFDNTNAQISFTNTYTHTQPLGKNWQTDLEKQTFEGGFFVEHALKKTLFEQYNKPKLSYPVFVIISDAAENVVLDKDFAEFGFTFPEKNIFYTTNQNGDLSAIFPFADDITLFNKQSVLAYPNAKNPITFLENDEKPSIILKNTANFVENTAIKPKNWASAAMLQAEYMAQTLHPETTDSAYTKLVQHSFASKILSPLTAYMVVENEAQKAVLLKKQAQVLAGNKKMDLGEETIEPMSEPSIWLLFGFVFVLLFYKRLRMSVANFRE
jgi:hypothetical protein